MYGIEMVQDNKCVVFDDYETTNIYKIVKGYIRNKERPNYLFRFKIIRLFYYVCIVLLLWGMLLYIYKQFQ